MYGIPHGDLLPRRPEHQIERCCRRNNSVAMFTTPVGCRKAAWSRRTPSCLRFGRAGVMQSLAVVAVQTFHVSDFQSLEQCIHVAASRALQENRLVVLDGVLTTEEVILAQTEATRIREEGLLASSGQPKPVRGDRLAFFSEYAFRSRASPTLAAAIYRLTQIANMLNLRTSVHETRMDSEVKVPLRIPCQAMLATYDGEGGRYIAHRDNELAAASGDAAKDDVLAFNARYLSLILYLNSSEAADCCGGHLRCHLKAHTVVRSVGSAPGRHPDDGRCADDCRGEDGCCHVDLAPIGGRLVIFFSQELLHEVRPSWSRRWAITLWVDDARIPESNSDTERIAFNRAADAIFLKQLFSQAP